MIFNILDNINPTELWMRKCIIGDIFSSSGATLHKNPLIKLCDIKHNPNLGQ